MRCFRSFELFLCGLVFVCFTAIEARVAFPQGTLTTQQTQTTQATQTTQTTQATQTTNNNTGNPGVAGVIVDPDGVLRSQLFVDQTGSLMRQRIDAARAQLDADLAKSSPLRMISLNRLEAAVKQRLDAGQKPTDEMKHLAGLTQIRFVFFYPETKDIVIAGPAEGWAPDLSGRVRGLVSQRPVLELDDLVTALRAFPPSSKAVKVISCSIDPTQEGLQRMQEFLKQIGSRATPGDTEYIVTGLRESLGLQNVRITGVPPTTHFAQVLVEADYRMKLIGIGLERPNVKGLISYVDRAKPAQVARNALQRWYFVPDYQCVAVSNDGMAMELVGEGVKLVSADEMVKADGTRAKASAADAASHAFTEGFTKKYAELAAIAPVYAQLRNCIDLSIAAAFIKDRGFYQEAGWLMPVFGDEKAYSVETMSAPKQVETAVTSVWRGNRLMTPIGGGVRIEPQEALAGDKLLHDDGDRIAQLKEKKSDLSKLAEGQWWWD